MAQIANDAIAGRSMPTTTLKSYPGVQQTLAEFLAAFLSAFCPHSLPATGCFGYASGRCGRSSVVERQLPKLYVAGSIPAARSMPHRDPREFGRSWLINPQSSEPPDHFLMVARRAMPADNSRIVKANEKISRDMMAIDTVVQRQINSIDAEESMPRSWRDLPTLRADFRGTWCRGSRASDRNCMDWWWPPSSLSSS